MYYQIEFIFMSINFFKFYNLTYIINTSLIYNLGSFNKVYKYVFYLVLQELLSLMCLKVCNRTNTKTICKLQQFIW